MPRKPNYGLNKHRKEQDRKAKKDAKMLERQQRREQESAANMTPDAEPTQGTDNSLPFPRNEQS
jgi:hypothetical protein